MRQVQDTLVWLSMILVVAGVIYAMPLVANLVAEARGEHRKPSVTGAKVSVSHHGAFSHRRYDR